MTYRRAVIAAILLAGLAVGAGCASETAGKGTFGGNAAPSDLPTGGGLDNPSVTPSSASSFPSESDSPSDEPSAEPSDTGGSKVPKKICNAVSRSDLNKVLHGQATASPDGPYSCKFSGQAGTVTIFEFSLLKLSSETGTKTQLGGHPAVTQSGTIVYVAETKNPKSDGILKGIDDGAGIGAVRTLLVKVLPTFAH